MLQFVYESFETVIGKGKPIAAKARCLPNAGQKRDGFIRWEGEKFEKSRFQLFYGCA